MFGDAASGNGVAFFAGAFAEALLEELPLFVALTVCGGLGSFLGDASTRKQEKSTKSNKAVKKKTFLHVSISTRPNNVVICREKVAKRCTLCVSEGI